MIAKSCLHTWYYPCRDYAPSAMMTVPTYVVNLERSVNRHLFVEQQMAKVKVPFEFISGVDGRLLDLTDPTIVVQSAATDGALLPGATRSQPPWAAP